MNQETSPLTPPKPAKASGLARWLPERVDPWALAAVLLGLGFVFVPTYMRLAEGVWATDEQGHGPIILAVALWLIFSKRHELADCSSDAAARALGWSVFTFAMVVFILGRSQDVLALEVLAKIIVFGALLLVFGGFRALRLAWFPLFFMLFMVPLPETLVAAVTSPLKSAVSYVASNILHFMGYPVGRSGVVLTVGQYQLLVADACAGLNSMFTLEALGLLYMNLMRYASVARNVTLAILIIPIAFTANIVRVMVLVLVTFHFGDEAGQGFVHDFAGMVLFMVALVLMLVTDSVLNIFFRKERKA
jgi:exosortase B